MYSSIVPADFDTAGLSELAARPAVTRLLSAWRAGDSAALQQLAPLVYDELRQLARRYMRRERNSHTLQPTAVVHEAFVRMVDMEIAWQDRTHFYAMAATLMRRILVDHAKGRQRVKRGGGAQLHSLDAAEAGLITVGPITAGQQFDVQDIDAALEQLTKVDERMARTLELHYFGGLTCPEIAQAMEVSETTIHRQLRLAKAWLLKELSGGELAEANHP
jgi:RNA polymerase sigma factor (TIGR02999 family)